MAFLRDWACSMRPGTFGIRRTDRASGIDLTFIMAASRCDRSARESRRLATALGILRARRQRANGDRGRRSNMRSRPRERQPDDAAEHPLRPAPHACSGVHPGACLRWRRRSRPDSCERRLLQELGSHFIATTGPSRHRRRRALRSRQPRRGARRRRPARRVPADANADAMAALERAVLAHPATRCAYAFALGPRRGAPSTGWWPTAASAFARCSRVGSIRHHRVGADGWRPVASFGQGFQPRGSNSARDRRFCRGQVRADAGSPPGRAVRGTGGVYGAAGFIPGSPATRS